MGEVADGLMRYDGIRPEIAVIPTGTGSDFARNFKVGINAKEIVDEIANGSPTQIDIGKIDYNSHDGTKACRHFINIASLGISGDIARSVNAVKAFGKSSGKLMFKYHTIRELLRYAFRNVSIKIDEEPAFDARIAVVVVANAPWFGGGMKIAPNADMADGLFDVLVFRAASRLRLIWDLNSVYSGAHLSNPLVSLYRARSVKVMQNPVQGVPQAMLDVDGEAPGTLPACYEIMPKALSIRANFL
jgi:YegS/Rv2252/BmrU family lipid kinase